MPKAKKASKAKSRAKPYKAAKEKATDASNQEETATTPETASPTTVDSANKVESYLFHVFVDNTFNPQITRILSIPSNYTFRDLHHLLQIAFGWGNCHAWAFEVQKHVEGPGEDPIRETVLTLLHNNDIANAYPEPDQIKKDIDYTLADIYNGEYKDNVEVTYEYDHGDGWEHPLMFMGIQDSAMRRVYEIPDDMPVFCISGEGHPAAEDSGGPGGFELFKKTMKKRSDPEDLKGWYKETCVNRDPKGFDPYRWDIEEVNADLGDYVPIARKSGNVF